MGCSSGKSMPGALSLPPQNSYSGHPVEYHTIIVEAELDVNKKFSLTRTDISIQSRNTDTYIRQLQDMYSRGYKMLSFLAVQDCVSYGFGSRLPDKIKVSFHGIFRKSFPDESVDWELKVEKSSLTNKMFRNWSGIFATNARVQSHSDNYHVTQTINDVAQRGGRLVAVEISGTGLIEMGVQRQKHMRRGVLSHKSDIPDIQVSIDVFYELPYSSSGGNRVYQIVNCPMTSSYVHKYPRGQFHSKIDWQRMMADYLGTGWRLVDIFEDYTSDTDVHMSGFTASVETCRNCLWVFEKPESSVNDTNPRYEGTMVEHYYKMVMKAKGMGFGGAAMNLTTDIEPVLNHMGKYGWELVRILATPDSIVSRGLKPIVYTRQLMFFQRKLEDRTTDTSLFHY